MRELGRLADAIVVHCEAARDALSETLALDAEQRARLRVIPHGHYAGSYADEITRDEARRRLGMARAMLGSSRSSAGSGPTRA